MLYTHGNAMMCASCIHYIGSGELCPLPRGQHELVLEDGKAQRRVAFVFIRATQRQGEISIFDNEYVDADGNKETQGL